MLTAVGWTEQEFAAVRRDDPFAGRECVVCLDGTTATSNKQHNTAQHSTYVVLSSSTVADVVA